MKMFEVMIFTVLFGTTEDGIKGFLREADNTFGPLGSGDHAFDHRDEDGAIIMKRLYPAPTSAALAVAIRIKGNQLWIPKEEGFADAMANYLTQKGFSFSSKIITFKSAEEAKEAFLNS